MIAGVCMVKDEADIVAETVGYMARQVDRVLVADNGSSDGTRTILEGLAEDEGLPVTVIEDPETGYYQSRKMTRLAERAADEYGADWVVPFDADEVWICRKGNLKRALEGLDERVLITEAHLYDHVPTKLDTDGPPVERITHRRRRPAPLPKVAVRATRGLTIHQGNHGATFDETDHPLTISNLLFVRHFPYRSPEQMIRKARNGAAAYAATDLPEEIGAHWRGYGRLSDAEIEDVFYRYFWSDDPAADDLVEDPCRP